MGERSSGKAFGAKTLRLMLRLRLINEQFKSPGKDKTCQAVHCRIIDHWVDHWVDRFGSPRLGAKYVIRQVVCVYFLGLAALAVTLVGLSVIYLNVYEWVLRKGGTDTAWFWFNSEPKGLTALREKLRKH